MISKYYEVCRKSRDVDAANKWREQLCIYGVKSSGTVKCHRYTRRIKRKADASRSRYGSVRWTSLV